LHNLSIVTRSGVRVLIDQAAGIVVSLLAALSLVALLTATAMLTATARAEIQRRMGAIGIRRAIGASRRHVTYVSALEALVVAVPAAALGVAAGALAATGPSERLLALLNGDSPGAALALPLFGCFLLTATIPALASAWPAWRAAGAEPVALLGGVELRPRARPSRGVGPSGLPRLGARLVTARRARLAATLASLAACASFVLLMLALVGELNTLVNDPAALGRRYQLTAALPASAAAHVRALPGVAAVAPRYEANALDSFSLGENIDVIAFPGDHTIFEDPALVSGRRLRGSDQTEVGSGLAQVLGLNVGSTLALALPSGHELRLQVSGIVSSLEHDGRVAYVPAGALLGAEPSAPEQLAVRVAHGASPQAVVARLQAQGSIAIASKGVAGSGRTLVDALKALLIVVAAIDGLVCVYTLVQALLLIVNERRSAIALLRACGAGVRSVGALLAGTALAVLVPAAAVAIVLERVVLGPAIAHIAAGYASLALSADATQIVALLAGLALLAGGAVWWVALRVSTMPISRELA
jgi:putative ABC transport system permease protein